MISPRHALAGDAVALHYDELDIFYREIWGEHVHHGLWLTGRESSDQAAEQLVTMVAARAHVRAGTTVCDVGCGYGATARMLARDFGAVVTGLTISKAQYEFAQSWQHRRPDGEPCGIWASRASYLLCDWLENELPAASFDIVIAVESLEHMADKQVFFEQAHRVLKPGGRIVVCAWLACEKPWKIEVRHLLEPICREGKLPGLGSELEYRRSFAEAGLRIERFEELAASVKKTWPICMGRVVAKVCSDSRYGRFLLNTRKHNRVFVLTMFRIWIAYTTGTMRYGVFTAFKPQ